MSLADEANSIILTLERLLRELSQIVDEARQDANYQLARDRIGRWKSRTVKVISEQVGQEEATALEERRKLGASYNPLTNVEGLANLYGAHVLALIDELRQHPADVLIGPPSVSHESTRRTVHKGFVFIAMSMGDEHPDLEDVHAAIKMVASGNGLKAERVDDPQTNKPISPRIVESLQTAEYVVADLTYSKPNVYYEAGYAEAIGTTPIYVAKTGTDIEFDVKDYPVIFFKNITELKKELSRRFEGLTSEPSAADLA